MQTTTYYRDFKNLVVKGSPLYQSSIVEQLDRVWGTWTGWAVLRAIIDSGKTVRIVPYSAEMERQTGQSANDNAHAKAANWQAAAPRNVRPYRGERDDPRTPRD